MYSHIFKTIKVPGLELVRDPSTLKKQVILDSKQVIPFKPTTWDISKEDSPIMLADTGKSQIVAIDFDGPEGDKNFHLALKIDPECKYIAKGIGKGGGHMIYKSGNVDLLKQYITSPNGCKISGLDLQMGRKLILLATEANKTKQLMTDKLTEYEELTDMPLGIQALVGSLYLSSKQNDTVITTASNSDMHSDSKLYYIVRKAIEDISRYDHKFFKVVTTRDYKALLTSAKGNKHPEMAYIPDNLPMDSSGNAYLVSIATILGRDPSIDADLFGKAMNYVNGLFSSPMPHTQVTDIVTYITSGNSKIGSETVWQYNPEWQKSGLIYVDHGGASHEVFIYNNKGANSFIDHNHLTNEVEYYTTSGAMIDNIKATSISKTNKEKLLSRSIKVKIVSTPLHQMGIIRKEYGAEFNVYRRTEEQEIFMNPDLYKSYEYPDVTVRFLENSMGIDRTHSFFLPFMKRKLKKREFSPLIMVLYGPPHSGKSAITNGILRPLTKGRNITLSPEILTEKYDDWKLNKDIVLIDEVHNIRSDYLQKMIQVMNTISGSDILTGIRAMQSSASSDEYPNDVTIFATCNKVVTLSTEAQDRRLVIMRSNMTASSALSMDNDAIQTSIQNESKDFAYYLATEVEELSKNKYSSNYWLKDEDYEDFQQGALPFTTAFTTAIDRGSFSGFEDLLIDFNISLEDIAASSTVVGHEIQVRLMNSNEAAAYSPALLGSSNVDTKNLIKELKNIHNTMVRRVDIKGGVRSLNKKTVASFNLDDIPDRLLELIKAPGIEPLED